MAPRAYIPTKEIRDIHGSPLSRIEFLSDFNFQIIYTPGKDNAKADILSRREQDLEERERLKLNSRSRILLSPDRLDPRINKELAIAYINSLPAILPISTYESDTLDIRNSSELIEELKQDNRQNFKDERQSLNDGFSVSDGLLLYRGRIYVQRNTPLYIRLISEIHDQVSSAHPNGKKTYQLLALQYHWYGIQADCVRYTRNCRPCQYSHPKMTKQQGFLYLLPVPAYPMQHLCMDYKDFPMDRHGFDRILVFIDRLGKDSVTIPCHQDIDARQTANEFCRIIGVKIKLLTAYHKQTDGQTEIMNRYIDQRLRPFVNYYQDN
ncbi:hypothetical protein VTL71DRAFT_3645 [Oculimacula yallundae]|uniref:Integrase zinc-binding domain-containing protein n=1 Tax=Oculimacula yallundae TaxID=86028 RepID=A0ABR4C5Y7_9HELO